MTLIVGGGISGLTAAHYLKGATVVEAAPQFGGVVRTELLEGCTVECGADSWLAAKSAAAELLAELNLSSEIIGSNDAVRRTWIWKHGRLVPYPRGMQLVAPTDFATIRSSSLYNPLTKLRMAADWLRRPGPPLPERSVGQFVRDHFGQEAVDYTAEPLLTGIYGGDVEQLSASSVLPKLVQQEREHGSLVRGLKATASPGSVFQSLRGGLGTMVEALKPAHSIQAKVEALEPGWRVLAGGAWHESPRVILAVPAHEAARLLAPLDAELASLLAGIPHSSGHIAAMGFRRTELNHPMHGFGFLVPRCEGRNLMAATWVSSKFENRAPADLQVIRAFFRSTPADPLSDLRDIMGIRAEPIFLRAYEWPDSLAQYNVGHAARVAKIQARVRLHTGLHLIGNAYAGVGIPDCIRLAKSTALACVSQ